MLIYNKRKILRHLLGCNKQRPVALAFVYHPPKTEKEFITDFKDFLSNTIPNFDPVLILGDFSTHVCCPAKPPESDFIHVVESFNLALITTCHKLGLHST